jgi:hypothetical protein
MPFIYLVNPIGTELRPIDKDKRFETGKRPKPPKVNNLNVKIGKWESDIKSLIKRYEYRVGNVNVKIVLEVDKNKIKVDLAAACLQANFNIFKFAQSYY